MRNRAPFGPLASLAGALAAVTLSAIVVASTRHAGEAQLPPPAMELPPREVSDTHALGETPLPPKSWVTERVVDGPPLSLTASDGSGLTLASLQAKAVVEGPLAFTEIHMAFDNPEDRVREGTFTIVLPHGASVGRLAMKIDGVWQEGEIVKKERARVAYEDALHHKQDPALMEKGAGNELTARVFPIPARGRKEILVSYTQELTGGAAYALPLRGLPQLGLLDVSVAGLSGRPQTFHQERFVPTEDFVAEGPASPVTALRSGNLVVTRVRPVPEAMPDPVTSAVVLVDTSASRALGLESELRAVKDMIRGLADRQNGPVSIAVAAFDQDVETIYQGDARGFGDAEIDKLVARRALGASNLQRALAWARDEAKFIGASRVVLVTDGVPTAGEEDASKLALAATSLRDGGATRLDIVEVGGIRDDALAHKLVTAGLAHDGVVADASDGAAAVVRRLESGTKSDVAVAVEGATWSHPTHLDGVQPGDESLVYAEVPEGAPLRVRVGNAPAIAVDASKGDQPLLDRGWAQAKIASLESQERDQGKSADLQRRIVDLSVKYRVLSSYTSLLVLESDADYARFDIDRRALADILTVDQGRFAWFKRDTASSLALQAPPLKKDVWGPPAKAASGVTNLSVAPAASAAPGTEDDALAAADSPAPMGVGLGGLGSIGHGTLGSGHAGPRGGTGERARGEEGSMGSQEQLSASRLDRAPAGMPAAPRAVAAAAPPMAAAPAATADAEPEPLALADGTGQAESSFRNHHASGGGGGAVVARPRPSVPSQGFASGTEERGVDPYTGKMKQVKDRLAARDFNGALAVASSWEASSPGDVLALVALGETAEATKDPVTASRAYGSIIDLFPSRADLRRFAGERLEHVQGVGALELAIDTFDKARRDRPDHPASHRLAAWARVRRGEYAAAFDILAAGAARSYPEGRFRGVDRILREDLGLVAAAWIKAEPSRRTDILNRLSRAGGTIEDAPSIRFVLNWETDANDVDFHIEDDQGGHAFFASPHLPSGGDLYADVTTGYGPECFTIRAAHGKRAGTYKLRAHYYARGPMGYGMGKLEVIDHDGHGGLKIEERPFVVMADHAFVNLGTVRD